MSLVDLTNVLGGTVFHFLPNITNGDGITQCNYSSCWAVLLVCRCINKIYVFAYQINRITFDI